MNDSAYSKESLANPYNDRITIAKDFLEIPPLKDVITDTHFAKRDRQGRLIAFMARILQDGMSKEIRGIGIDEKSAGLMEPDGAMKIVGFGIGAYFYHPTDPPEECVAVRPLTFQKIAVEKVTTGGEFNVSKWQGNGQKYWLSTKAGALSTTMTDGALY
jgi:cyanophycinase